MADRQAAAAPESVPRTYAMVVPATPTNIALLAQQALEHPTDFLCIHGTEINFLEIYRYAYARVMSLALYNGEQGRMAIAEAGFYMGEEPGFRTLHCNFCNIIMINLPATPSIQQLHRSFHPACPFVVSPEAAGNINIYNHPNPGELSNFG